MHHFRANLSRLRTQVEQKLPDGEDLFGYNGISKPLLLSAIELTYALSQGIEEREDATRFEVIALKRGGSDTYKFLTDFLDSDLEGKKTKEKFNDFLNALSSLIEKTKMTYFIVTKNGLRDDTELSIMRNQTKEYQAACEELVGTKEELDAISGDIRKTSEEVLASHESTDKYFSEVSDWHKKVSLLTEEITQSHESIEGWDKDIQERDTQFRTLAQQISQLSTESRQLKESLQALTIEGGESSQRLKGLETQNRELQEEITLTLGDANRVGMAASFKERKEELQSNQKTWQWVFVLAVSAIIPLSAGLLLPEVLKKSLEWHLLFTKAAIVVPLIWLGWFAARQFSYISRIREDYAFKYAASMAYEGHKKATREVDKDLERLLLEFSLFNMSQNPIRLYSEKLDHVTPMHEFASTILDKLPNLRDVAFEKPGMGKISVNVNQAKAKENE